MSYWIDTRASKLNPGDELTEAILVVLHWAERYTKTGHPMDAACMCDALDRWLNPEQENT